MIYFVEDDKSIRELVLYTLQRSGYEAAGFENSGDFFGALEPGRAELVLLDIMLPGEDGLQILGKLRAQALTEKIPVIMVTALGSEYDKVLGLDSGADDYISKPFGMMELLARVRAVLRRKDERHDGLLSAGGVVLGTENRRVTAGGAELQLTLKEFELLKCLLANKGRVMSRDKLLLTVWGYDYEGETRTIDVHIRTLRHKLGGAGSIIETVRGIGYRVTEP